MHCPVCQSSKTSVERTLNHFSEPSIERHRYCKNCGEKFWTVEITQPPRGITVIKQDKRNATFSYQKLYLSIQKNCKNLGIPFEEQRTIFLSVMSDLAAKTAGKNKIKSQEIGEVVIRHMKSINRVAWLRYIVHFYDSENTILKMIELESSGEEEL